MVPFEKLDQITRRFEFLEARLSAGAGASEIAALSREYADLKPVAAEIAAYRGMRDALAEAEAMRADPEMRALAEEEALRLRGTLPLLLASEIFFCVGFSVLECLSSDMGAT